MQSVEVDEKTAKHTEQTQRVPHWSNEELSWLMEVCELRDTWESRAQSLREEFGHMHPHGFFTARTCLEKYRRLTGESVNRPVDAKCLKWIREYLSPPVYELCKQSEAARLARVNRSYQLAMYAMEDRLSNEQVAELVGINLYNDFLDGKVVEADRADRADWLRADLFASKLSDEEWRNAQGLEELTHKLRTQPLDKSRFCFPHRPRKFKQLNEIQNMEVSLLNLTVKEAPRTPLETGHTAKCLLPPAADSSDRRFGDEAQRKALAKTLRPEASCLPVAKRKRLSQDETQATSSRIPPIIHTSRDQLAKTARNKQKQDGAASPLTHTASSTELSTQSARADQPGHPGSAVDAQASPSAKVVATSSVQLGKRKKTAANDIAAKAGQNGGTQIAAEREPGTGRTLLTRSFQNTATKTRKVAVREPSKATPPARSSTRSDAHAHKPGTALSAVLKRNSGTPRNTKTAAKVASGAGPAESMTSPEKVLLYSVHSLVVEHPKSEEFREPVTDDVVSGYSDVVKQSIDLQKIKSLIDRNQIRTLRQLSDHYLLMCTNAIMFNCENHVVNKDARELRSFCMNTIQSMRQPAVRKTNQRFANLRLSDPTLSSAKSHLQTADTTHRPLTFVFSANIRPND